MILINLISALLLTEAVEFTAAFLMGCRGKEFYKILGLINIVTNPLLNYIIQVLFFFNLLKYRFPIVILLEMIVVIVEWRLFVYALPKGKRSYLLLSAVINASSFLVGFLIFG
jgi:hypothetical protein